MEVANVSGDATELLHERVVLHRLDGTAVHGRAAVVEAVANRGSEMQFAVVGTYGEAIHVAIVVDGIPGHVLMTMTGTVEDGRLIEIWMD